MATIHETPTGWRRVRLQDVAEVVGGSTPSRTNPDYWFGDIPWVAPSELTDLPGRYLDCSRESISEHGRKAAGLRVLPPGSVLLTSRATIGATAINRMPVTTNQGFQSLVPKRDTHGLWLYYSVSASRRELERRGAGSTFREVSRDGVRSLPILVPPIHEQRRIAAILDSIDEAIERTEEVIAATERLRDALLHDLLTRGLPGRHTEWKGVRGLGTIPACWDVVRLGDVGRWLSGGTPSKKNPGFWTGPLPWVSPKDMKTREIYDTRDHISDVAAQQGSRTVLADSVLVVVRGMILAHTFPLAVTRRAVAFNQDIRALECSGNAVPDFVLVSLESQTHRLLQLPTPSTHGTMRVVMDEFLDITMPTPSVDEQLGITRILAGVDLAVDRLFVELHQLSSLKTVIADALLSGMVRGIQE